MHQIKAGSIVLLALCMLAMVFVACDMGSSETRLGALEVILKEELTAKTLTPELDMHAAVYKISATRVGSSDVLGPVDVTADAHTFTGILTGSWIVKVEAFNDDSPMVKIGEGSTTVTVSQDSLTKAFISVVPLAGNGSFTFTLNWPGNLIGTPTLDAYLTAEGASPAVAVAATDITISGSTATITVDELPTGYYDFSFMLKNDGKALFGDFHEVRILAGQETSAVQTVPVSPLGISTSIVNNLRNPFLVEISSEDFMLECANIQSFSAAPANAAAYQWYLDGILIAGADKKVFEIDGEGMPQGWHTLAVKVKQFDGSVSSDTKALLLDPLSGTGGWMDLTFTNTADESDVHHFWMTSGPAENAGFDAIATFPEYDVPIQLEMTMPEGPGSFMVAATVPLAIEPDLDMYPKGGKMWHEHQMLILGAWNVKAETVELGKAYNDCMLFARVGDGQDIAKEFSSVENFYNPLVEGVPKWGDLSEICTEDVNITFTKYGGGLGTYVKGTVSGSVLSVIEGTPQTLGIYTVTGSFVASRAMLLASE